MGELTAMDYTGRRVRPIPLGLSGKKCVSCGLDHVVTAIKWPRIVMNRSEPEYQCEACGTHWSMRPPAYGQPPVPMRRNAKDEGWEPVPTRKGARP